MIVKDVEAASIQKVFSKRWADACVIILACLATNVDKSDFHVQNIFASEEEMCMQSFESEMGWDFFLVNTTCLYCIFQHRIIPNTNYVHLLPCYLLHFRSATFSEWKITLNISHIFFMILPQKKDGKCSLIV